MAAYFVCMLTK